MSHVAWQCLLTSACVCLYMYVSLLITLTLSPKAEIITKGAAQQDWPNAYVRRLWLPPNGHEWSRSKAAKPDVFDLGKGQTTTPQQVYVKV